MNTETNTLEKQSREPTPTTDKGKLIIRMSSSGHCIRALTAELSGKYEDIARPEPVWLAESATEGNMHEQWIKNQLFKDGFSVFDEQLELKIEQPEFILLGHIDGKCQNMREDVKNIIELLEIKSMSQFEFQRWQKGKFDEFPYYASQLACYVTATELNDVRYIVKNRSSGYKDINLLNGLTLNGKPYQIKEVYDRCNLVAYHIEHNTLPEVEYDGSSLQCRRCAFDKLCITDTNDLAELANDSTLIECANKYRESVVKLEELENTINEQKAIFKSHLLATGIKKPRILCNNLAVQLVDVRPRINYPKKAMMQFITGDELLSIAEPKEGYSFVRIDDKLSERMEYKKDED